MTRYTRIAIGLHWLIAIALVANMALGWWMSDAISNAASRDSAVSAFQWHKSIGLTILLLSLLRLIWRFLHPAPRLPDQMPLWERRAAILTHTIFYLLMIGIPLSGWLYVSTQWRGDAPFTIPTLWFNLFEVPHLFGLNETGHALRQSLASISFATHELLVWAMLLLLFLHVAAALRHHLVLNDGLLARMLPWLDKPHSTAPQSEQPPARPKRLAASLTVLTAFTVVLLGTRSAPPQSPDAAAMQQALNALSTNSASSTTESNWEIMTDKSEIRFSGSHVGRAFKGQFTEWLAYIQLDPDSPEQAHIVAVIKTASATDGVPMHDSTLPEAEWFNVDAHPFAHFQATEIKPVANDQYALSGLLTIKNHSVDITGLTLQIDAVQLHIHGEASIARAAVNMGMESDPAGDYVSPMIGIHIDITARRRP